MLSAVDVPLAMYARVNAMNSINEVGMPGRIQSKVHITNGVMIPYSSHLIYSVERTGSRLAVTMRSRLED